MAKSANDVSILHPEFKSKEYPYEKGLTVKQAKELLGWEEEPEGGKFGDKYDLLDQNKKKVRLTRGQGTPFLKDHALEYAYDTLNKRIKFNGQPVTIGKTGTVHSGRHRLAGLILAAQIQLSEAHKDHWAAIHGENEVTLPCLVVYGIDDDDETVNTIDTGNSRSTSDMLYRSDVFRGKKADMKKRMSKALALAIPVVWERTGAKYNPWAPRKTHSEVMDFLNRHKRLIKVVEHVVTENSDGGLNTILKEGILSGYVYLMAASLTDAAVYGGVEPSLRQETGKKGIDFENYDKACQFVVDLNVSKKLIAVAEKIGLIVKHGADGKSLGGTVKERIAVLIRAWNLYVRGKKITLDDLDIGHGTEKGATGCYQRDEDGKLSINDNAILGGIDFGPTGKLEVPESEETTEEEVEVVEEEVEVEEPKKKGKKPAKKGPVNSKGKTPDDYMNERRKKAPVVEQEEEDDGSGDVEPSESEIVTMEDATEELGEEGEDE